VDRLRADSIHLIGLNAREGRATILGFPRDSYVPIPGHGTSKINDAMVLGGPQLVVRTVASVTGIEPDYYMLTSFEGLVRMIDAVGGVTVDIPYPMNDPASGTNFSPGPRELRGGHALAFARDRHSAPRGDFDRSFNHGTLMIAALRKYRQDLARNPAFLFRWVRAGMRNIETDLSLAETLELAFTAATIRPRRVTNLVVPGTTGSAGGASVVFISGAAGAIYRDLEDDGVVEG
jgi:LCP family protein required for cell wall assembly